MKIMDYLSRNYFGPLYNIWRGFGGINSSIAHWQGVATLSEEELRDYERERLREILQCAYNTTDYYHRLFDGAGVADELDDPEVLVKIPLLTKELIRVNTEAMFNSTLPADELLKTMTGGSTGEPLIFYRDRGTYCARWGLQAAANMALGWEPGEWYALIWGAGQDLPQEYSARYRLLNFLAHRRIILNAGMLTDEQTTLFVKSLKKYRPRILYGYPAMLDLLATAIRENALDVPIPEKVIVTAEPLTVMARENIEAVFRAPVINRYASREFGVVADQCGEPGFLKVVRGSVKIEILPISEKDPSFGELVITDLLNIGMPFIRYRTGDIGRLSYVDDDGRPGIYLSEIAGRTSDMIVSPTGRIISGTALTPSFFTAHPGIKQAQIRQEAPDRFRILVVRNWDEPFDDGEAKIARTLGEYCDAPVHVSIDIVESIPRDKSGKFRFVISSVTPELFHSASESPSHVASD